MSLPDCQICNHLELSDETCDPRAEIESVSDDSEYPSDFDFEHGGSDEEEESDDDTQKDDNVGRRVTREAKSRSKHHHRHAQHQRSRQVSDNRVLMPTGHTYYIPIGVTPKWKCGSKIKLIYLGPGSKKGGREYNIVEKEMQNTIVSLPNCESSGGCFNSFNIIKIQKIVQGCAWRRYQTRKKDVAIEAGSANERMLFHGTDAVWTIVRGGFDERYASTNGQFGAGLYFAKHSSLANQFVFGYFGGNGCPKHHDKNCYICERHMLLCRVILGKSHKLTSVQNMPHPPPGFHSVEAVPTSGGGINFSEYVVYRGEQVYPEYLITYKIVRPDRKDGDGGKRKLY